MNIGFDLHNNAEPKNIFLGTPDKKVVCAFNSIKEETVDLRLNLNNACELTFRMDKYIDVDGELVEANGYDIVNTFSRIYVEDIGWFICDTPKTENDGFFETKEIMAESIEMEFMQHDLVGLKVNHGTTDSLEMLAEGNVTVDEVGIEFATEQVKFYNPDNPELSLLDLVLRESELRGWKIGHVDNSPKIYRNYVDGEIVETMTNLHDEIGFFQIDSKTVYSFLTQDVATYFECMVLFDINNLTINVYRVESLGEDTGINIGFRNLEKSNLIEVTSPKSVFTRLRVAGGNGLGITFVNFGSNMIENIEYFLNTKFMPLETIKKYRAWHKDMSEKRLEFISLSRQHNAKLEHISELTNRVPLDDTSRDWSTFTLEDLENRLLDFQAQQRGIETFFIDENGDLDSVRLRNSSLWKDYTQIVNYIIPNIKIAIANKQAERQDEIQDFIPVKDWSLYGLSELQMRIRKFEGERDIYIRNGFNVPWHEGNGNSRDMHNFNHQKYVDVTNMLDSSFRGSAAEALMLRQDEINLAESERETLASKRRGLMYSVQKENWKHDDFEPFTDDELYLLHNALYNDTDYINENMFLVSSDTTVTAVDEQLKLLDVAEKELVAISQPQYRYDTTLDNFLAMHDYKDFAKQLILGNFINLGVRDDYYVKLRLISISFNPLAMDNQITLEFSNMVRNASGRNDFASLLESANNAAKNQIFGSSGGTGRNEDNLSVRALMNRMIQAMEFNNAIGNAVNREVGGLLGSMLRLQELEAQMIRVTNITGENGFFQYLQAQLIAADQIIARSANFDELKTRVANIGSLLAGEVVAQLGHIIRLTSRNVVIEEAVIKELIAAQIMVADLKAGDISTNSMNLVSDDGGLKIVGNTMQFHDSDGNLRIQIGRDSTDNFSFTLFDAEGKGVLIDQDGIRESAISDGLIRGDMISNNTISRDKLNFNIVEGDENGNLDASKVVINGNGIDAEFTRIRNSITTIQSEIENGVVGRDGISVEEIYLEYYHSLSTTEQIGGEWSTEEPVWQPDRFIWTRTVARFSDGSYTRTAPICVSGASGASGADGRDGVDGMNSGSNLLIESGNYRPGVGLNLMSAPNVNLTMHNGFIRLERIVEGTGNGWMLIPLSEFLERGKEYTAHFRIRRSVSNTFNLIIFENRFNPIGNTTTIPTGLTTPINEWVDMHFTFTVPTAQTWIIRGFGFGSNAPGVDVGDFIEVAWITLAEGVLPKTWQPHPSDLRGMRVGSNLLLTSGNYREDSQVKWFNGTRAKMSLHEGFVRFEAIASGINNGWAMLPLSENLKPGSRYTLHCRTRGVPDNIIGTTVLLSSNFSGNAIGNQLSPTTLHLATIVHDGDWTEWSTVFQVPANHNWTIRSVGLGNAFIGNNEGDFLEVAWITLTEGIETRLWQPHPSDLQGQDGLGIGDIVPQYYSSTSNTELINGEWSNEQPKWEDGRFIWERNMVIWSDDTITFTTPTIATWLNEIKTSISGVSSKVNAVESSIENRIWRDDIIIIEDGEGNEIEQSIQSLLTHHQMRVGNIQSQVTALGSRMEDGMQEIIINMSSLIEQTAEMIASSVRDNITGENSYVNQMADEIFQQLENAQNDLSILSQTATELTSRITNNEDDLTEVKQTANLLMQRLTTTENDIQTIVTQAISAAEGWKVHMARIGAYEGRDVPDGALSTTMRIREDGVTINSNDSRQAVRLTGREVAGYFNFDGQHGLLSRNLLITSGNFQVDSPIKWYARHPEDFSISVHDGFVRITKHSAITQNRWVVMPLIDTLVPNKQYSYTIKWRRNRNANEGFRISIATRHFSSIALQRSSVGRTVPANTWNEMRWTFVNTIPGTYMVIPSDGLTQVGDTLDIEYWMFNEGENHHPPWEPAPEKIFGIDEDIVYSNRLLVDNGIDLVNQKVIPVTYSRVKGLAFVKSGGTS